MVTESERCLNALHVQICNESVFFCWIKFFWLGSFALPFLANREFIIRALWTGPPPLLTDSFRKNSRLRGKTKLQLIKLICLIEIWINSVNWDILWIFHSPLYCSVLSLCKCFPGRKWNAQKCVKDFRKVIPSERVMQFIHLKFFRTRLNSGRDVIALVLG